MTNDLKLKLDPQALRVLKNLTSALDDVAKALQISNRQKPKNSELRLTETFAETYGVWGDGYRSGQKDAEKIAKSIPQTVTLTADSIEKLTEAVQPYLKDRRNDLGAF